MHTRMAVAALVLSVVSTTARANAAPPADYWIRTAEGGTVTIHLAGTDRTCAEGPLLRRNLDTGERVQITACLEDQTFVDQCVPAGRYQYGLATPLECSRFGTMYYAETTLAGPEAAGEGCTRSVAAPTPAEAVPWGETRVACESTYGEPGSSGGCSTGPAVLGLNAVVLAAGALAWRRRRTPGR